MPIRLHPEKGVNPYLTYCQRCGEDGPELLLLGAVDKIYKCTTCDMQFIGNPKHGKCPKCCVQVYFHRKIEERERLPGGLCDSCVEEEAQFAEVVKEGGIIWKCKECHRHGVIKAGSELAIDVRKQLGVAPPDPCGIEFTKEECPACTPENVET